MLKYFNFEPSFKLRLWLSGLGNCIVCKRFAVQTLLWLLKFVIQINLEHGTIKVKVSSNYLSKVMVDKNWNTCLLI